MNYLQVYLQNSEGNLFAKRHKCLRYVLSLPSLSLSSLSQRSFTEAVRLYDKGDYEGAVALFEEALVEYFKADVDCRALCQGPQRFESHDHLRYRYSLHELVSGKSKELEKKAACIYLHVT